MILACTVTVRPSSGHPDTSPESAMHQHHGNQGVLVACLEDDMPEHMSSRSTGFLQA
jgi:hypothetical protein